MRYFLDYDADVIVVGAGLGGSAVAWQLAEHGLTVLVLEAGPAGTEPTRGVRRGVAQWLGAPDPRLISFSVIDPTNGKRPRPVLTRHGRGPGGSSTLYAAALGRMKRSDFVGTGQAATAHATLSTAWPIDYDGFKPYYRRAEALMRVRGERDPGDAEDDADLLSPPPLSVSAEGVRAALLKNGHHPYRLHVAIDYVDGCGECVGRRCARNCKADGYNRALSRAAETGRVRLATDLTVYAVAVTNGGVTVSVREKDGHFGERRARRLVVAAGALNTPLLLRRSADLWRDRPRPIMLARGLMFHVTDRYVVDTPGPPSSVPRKWLGLRDFYGDGSVDLGEIQSTGSYLQTGTIMRILRERLGRVANLPVPALVELLRPAAWCVAHYIGPRPIFATITEDLPHAKNHVCEKNGRIVVLHATDPQLRQRALRMRAAVRAAFAPLGLRFLTTPGTPNWGHPMGTCRMGADRETSVVAPGGYLHDHPEIFIADASIFPSSGGTGPALTVLAHALRVADRIADELALPKPNAAGEAAG